MTKKNFLLLSLDDVKTKKIANVVNNVTSSKILEYLTKKEATEGELVKELKLAASTVNYNLKQLVESNLVETEEYHYSEKGKEVKHYKLANSYVIIAPRGSTKEDFLEKIKNVLPGFGFLFLGTLGVFLYEKFNSGFQTAQSSMIMESYDMATESTMMMAKTAPVVTNTNEPSAFLWFFLGGFITLIFLFLYRLILTKLKKSKK
jgi:predicted transcriptional regulator